MVTTTASPAAAPVTAPLTSCVWPCSALLMMSSVATVLMVTTGAAVSTVRVWLAEPVLPAASATLAVTVPLARDATSAAGTVTLQLPLASTWVV
ncbi:hypothetical protein CISEMA079M_15380 [Citrobacter sedlakii]